MTLHLPAAPAAHYGELARIGKALGSPVRLRLLDLLRNGTFFGIYYMMTGLHGIHVLVGIGLFLWILRRARAGHFGPGYYGPVDAVALYWHLVDVIWIYLFPLFYLI